MGYDDISIGFTITCQKMQEITLTLWNHPVSISDTALVRIGVKRANMVQKMQMLPDVLQRLKETELHILMAFDQVCRQIGVCYTLSSGTLLGAVRHGGFIPWDDDIDVAMLREDYNRFMAEGQRLLPEHLFIQTYATDCHYPHHFGKIRDLSTTLIEFAHQRLPMQSGVYIDIFPVDRVSTHPAIRWMDNIFLKVIWLVKYSHTVDRSSRPDAWIKTAVKRILNPLARFWGLQRLNRIETRIRTRNNISRQGFTFGDTVASPCSLKAADLMPLGIFCSFQDMAFEKKTFRAVKDTHTYLSIMYGDYMQPPPLHQRRPAHDFMTIEFHK